MEYINSFVFIEIKKEALSKETICITKNDDKNIYLKYLLSKNDCVFDFTDIASEINITISKDYFLKYNETFEFTKEQQSICCNTQSKLIELINCKLKNIERNIYIESIVLYLIFQVKKNSLITQFNCDNCSIINKFIDVEKIYKAKEFILNNLDKNITVPMLATYLATNQCYLKKGFKEIIGQTISDFIQENRMVKAKHLLNNSEQSISDIAYTVGYSSISSFSQMYKSYFGIAPSLEKPIT